MYRHNEMERLRSLQGNDSNSQLFSNVEILLRRRAYVIYTVSRAVASRDLALPMPGLGNFGCML
jgi:hypothetical protein